MTTVTPEAPEMLQRFPLIQIKDTTTPKCLVFNESIEKKCGTTFRKKGGVGFRLLKKTAECLGFEVVAYFPDGDRELVLFENVSLEVTNQWENSGGIFDALACLIKTKEACSIGAVQSSTPLIQFLEVNLQTIIVEDGDYYIIDLFVRIPGVKDFNMKVPDRHTRILKGKLRGWLVPAPTHKGRPAKMRAGKVKVKPR